MLENERLVKTRKNNMKLYPIYRAVGVDIVFLYATKMLFLTQVKSISVSDIIFSVSMYAFFMAIMQLPATIIIEKIGYRKSAFLSNVFNIMYVAVLMISTNVWWLIFAEFLSTLTFALKDVAEPSLLNESIPKTDKKGKIYSKLEGKGIARYYYIDAIANVLSGVIYAINQYFPMILSIIFSVFACVLSLQFIEIDDITKNKEKTTTLKEYVNDMKTSFKFILKSNRLKSLLLYSAIIWGVYCLIGEYKDSILIEIGTSSTIIGIIAAILGIVSGVASKKQVEFHNRFRNKSLGIIAISMAVSSIISGLIVIIKAPFTIELVVITLAFIIIKIDNAMSKVLLNRYLANFSNPQILPKIYTAAAMIKNILRTVIGILGSILMTHISTEKVMFMIGIVFLIIVFILLKYMKTRVGLKPEEYKKEEIELV